MTVMLLRISATLTAIATIVIWSGLIEGTTNVPTSILTIAMLLFFANKLSAGRNWARWVVIVVFALGVVFVILAVVFVPNAFRSLSVSSLVVMITQTVLQTVSLLLLFSRESVVWFRMQRVNATGAP